MQFHFRRAAAVLLLVALVLGTVPASAVAVSVLNDPTDTAATETTAPAKPTAKALVEDQDTGQREATAEVETQSCSGLLQLIGGVYVPYDGMGGGTKAPPADTITYKDIFNAHSSDLTSGYNYIKAGGAYTANSYGEGDTAWFPAANSEASKELSYDGSHYVCTGKMFSNHGPNAYLYTALAGGVDGEAKYLALPIRPSQEDGIDGTYNATNYARAAGVPSYKLENLKSKQIPAYSQAEFTTINLINAVANGMGGMKYESDANLTAAGYTLIMNVVFGYIGLGSDSLFHGLPIATNNTTVNQKMCEILVRCEIYSKQKSLTGNATGDVTLTRLKNYLGYTPTNMDGYYVASGTASYQNEQYLQINKSQSSGNQIYLWAANMITFDNGKPVKLQKKTGGSINDCITNNPLYSLQGAKYEIYLKDEYGNKQDAITVTTGADGSVTTEKKFGVGTTVYAKEITAPAGYLLNSKEYSLVVSTNESQNVFEASDDPIFDPEAFKLTKTGTSSQRISGAIFKAEYYASVTVTGTAVRTWYFQSDPYGVVDFNDDHLAADYQSDALYKPNGENNRPSFPLGCVKVTEIKAASGYILPKSSQGTAYLYVRQTAAGGDATAYWGDSDGNPVNTLGMYTITNAAVTAVNEESGTGTMKKALTDGYDGNKAGYSFKLARQGSADPWFGVSDENGDVYLTDESFAAILADGSKVYTFENLEDGKYWLVEYLASVGIDDAKPESVHISTSGGSTAAMDVTLSGDQLAMTDDGDCSLFGANGLQLTGLNDGGTLTVEITNTPMAELEIVKTSPNGSVSGVSFTVEQEVSGTWQPLQAEPFTTGASGKINIPELVAGTKLRITEIVPDNYICTTENPQIVTLEQGLNTVTFDNLYIGLTIIKTATDGKIAGVRFEVRKNVDDQWVLLGTYTTNTLGQIAVETEHLAVGAQFKITEIVPDGYFCTSENPRTITLAAGMNYITFNNTPIGLTIIKTATDGKIDGIEFTVDIKNDANEWDTIGTFETGTDGKINVPREHLIQGATYRITEIVPDNYICTTENPQIVTLEQATTTVTFANKPFSGLEIVKTSRDNHVAGFRFTIEKAVQVGAYTGWQPLDPGTEFYVSDETGKIVIDDDTLLATGMTLRITELEHENYICLSENPQTVTLRIGKNSVNFVNEPVAKLSLVKTCEDGNVDGIQFKLEKKLATEQTGVFAGRERWELIGTYTTYDGGVIAPEDFGLLTVDGIYRVTELVPRGYVCDTPVQTFTAHIGENSVSFKNRQAEGKISVHKEDAEGRPMQSAQFLLEYSMDDGAGWEPIQSRSVKDPVQPGYCTSEGLTDGILSSGADGNVVFTGLALSTASNGNVKYRLTEVKTQNGSTLLGVTVFEGLLPVDDYELSYRVVNETAFQLPHTGGNGFAFTGITFGFAILAALLILFKLPRKKEEKYN